MSVSLIGMFARVRKETLAAPSAQILMAVTIALVVPDTVLALINFVSVSVQGPVLRSPINNPGLTEFFLSTFWPQQTARLRLQTNQKACPGSQHVEERQILTESDSFQGVGFFFQIHD